LHSRQGVHAAVFSQPAYFYFMQKEGLKPEQFGPMLYLERNKEQWMFVRRGMPDPVKAKLKEVIDRMRNEGVYESILRKYGTPVA
ncbi:MAG TPA: hypothetical protein VFP68_05665, partial [Burkholderiaceae bacterium]|nr:hypothetical protein [Burkholderiaceae bacterium]